MHEDGGGKMSLYFESKCCGDLGFLLGHWDSEKCACCSCHGQDDDAYMPMSVFCRTWLWKTNGHCSMTPQLASTTSPRDFYYSFTYELGFNRRSAGSVASVFIDGVLHRETSNLNHKLNDITFLDSFINPQTRHSRKQLGG